MNVLLSTWCHLPGKGGLETCIANISKSFKNKGIELIVVAAKSSRSDKTIDQIDTTPLFRIYPSICWSSDYRTASPISIIYRLIIGLPSIIELIKIIRQHRIQVINLHYLSPVTVYVYFVARMLNIKVVVSLHGALTQGVYYGTIFEKWLFKNLLKMADFVTACSQDLLSRSLSLCPNLKQMSKVIVNGVDLEEYNLDCNHKFRRRYIFTMGTLAKRKGFDVLIFAFKHLIKKRYDIDLIIAGAGLEEENLRRLTRLLKLEKNIIFFWFVEGPLKIKLLKECEFFVLPSRIEPFGIVNLEAMAAGKAIVAADIDGVPEIIKDGINGILVQPYNDKALAESMIRLLEDKGLAGRLGRNTRQMVEDSKFRWDNIAEQYIEIYSKCCKSNAN